MSKKPHTADRLRHDIDHGRGGDKVSFSDPAAAPLGTDAEAAGTPPSEEQLRRAREAEIKRADDESTGRNHRTIQGLQSGQRGLVFKILAIFLVVSIGIALVAVAV